MPVEEQQHEVRQRAGSQATRLREVDTVAEFAALPFPMIQVFRNRCEAAFGETTAAAFGADQ